MNLVQLKQSIDTAFNDAVPDESIYPSTIAAELKKIIDYTNLDILASKSNISTTYIKNSTQWVVSPGDNLEVALGKISFGIEALMLLTEALKVVQERSANSGTNTGDQNLTLYALLNSPTFSGTVTIPELMLGQNSYPSTLGAPNQVLTTNGYGVLFWKTPAASTGGTTGTGGTTQDLSAYATLNSPAFTGMVTGITKLMINLGNVPNTDFTSAVNLNTNKISFDSVASTRLKDTSGVNTGDQDLSGKVDKITGFGLSKNDLTNLLKIAYDNAVTWISTNGSNLISHLLLNNNPHSVTAAQVGAPSGSGTSTGSNTGDQDLSVKVDKAPGERLINALEISKVGNQSGTNTGDQFIPTTLPASDVSAWAKAAVKPSYTTNELADTLNRRYVTDTEKAIIANAVSAIGNTVYTGVSSYTAISIGTATGNTIAWTGSDSNLYRITLSKDSVLSNPTAPITGAVYQFIILQNGTGLWSLSYGNMFKWPDGAAPVIDANANSKGILTALYDGTVLLVVSIQNFL